MWAIGSVDYLNATIKTVEGTIKKRRWRLPTRATTPMTKSYYPELDATPELLPDNVTIYQEIIGMMRWATEIGRVDILHKISPYHNIKRHRERDTWKNCYA